MDASSRLLGASVQPNAVMAFNPATLVASTPFEVSSDSVSVRYQVQGTGGGAARPLDGNPALSQPVPTLRLGVNAVATFLIIILAGLVMAATAPRLLGYDPVVVSSGSMEPAIRTADVVITSPTEGADLDEGAVINFDSDGSTILHRIVAVTPDGYQTAGDANDGADSTIVSPAKVRGVGIMVVPFVGLPATWVDRGQWFFALAALIGVVGALYVSRGRWVDAKSDPLRA